MKVLPKIVRMLTLFSHGGEFGFGEIVERTRLTRSNAAHLTSALCECGLLEKSGYGKYRIGPMLFELTGGSREAAQLAMFAERAAANIAGELGELGVVGCFWRDRRITLAKAFPDRMVQLRIADRWFENSGWYRLSSGRLLLAMQPDDRIAAVIEQIGLPPAEAWPEAVTMEGFRAEIERIRTRREVVMQRENGSLTSLAVPVQDADGADSLCVSTVYVTGRKSLSDAEVVDRLRSIASDLETQIVFHHLAPGRMADPRPSNTENLSS